MSIFSWIGSIILIIVFGLVFFVVSLAAVLYSEEVK